MTEAQAMADDTRITPSEAIAEIRRHDATANIVDGYHLVGTPCGGHATEGISLIDIDGTVSSLAVMLWLGY